MMKSPHTLGRLLSGLLLITPRTTHASLILNENFNSYIGNYNNQQYESVLNVSFGGTVAGWNGSGEGAIHAVNLNGTGNFAAMFYRDNVITLALPIAANDLGVGYTVAFDAGPAVYAYAIQQTTAADGLIVEILRGNNSVLSQFTFMPGAWAGSETLVPSSFQYTGDGSGGISVRIQTVRPTADAFGGAIDNLSVSSVPEPTTTLLAIGSGAMLLLRRRRATV